MNKQEFLDAIGNRKVDLNLYWNEFSNMDKDTFKQVIATTKNFNEMKIKKEKLEKNIGKMNLNSSYWYDNLRDIKPYFDITNGKPLEPWRR